MRREVHSKKTHTNIYLQFSSNHTDNAKTGVIQGLVNRAATVSSDQRAYRQEIGRIISALRNNGYPRKFVERRSMGQSKRTLKENEQGMRTVRIQHVEGLSHEVRRIVWKAGIRCVFYANKHFEDYTAQKINCRKRK